MTKNKALLLLAVLPLSGCFEKAAPALPVVTTQDQAKAAASFCTVAEYQPVLAADPVETQAMKASNNAKGAYLKCAWAK